VVILCPDLGGPGHTGGFFGRGRFGGCPNMKKPRRRGEPRGASPSLLPLGRENLAPRVTVTAYGGLLPKSTVTHQNT
jgi:hypothetical protein